MWDNGVTKRERFTEMVKNKTKNETKENIAKVLKHGMYKQAAKK